MKRGLVILFSSIFLLWLSCFISAVSIDPFKNMGSYHLEGFYPISESQLMVVGTTNNEVVPNGTGYGHLYSLFNIGDGSLSNFSFDSEKFSPYGGGQTKDYFILKYSDSYLLSHRGDMDKLINEFYSYNKGTGELKYLGTSASFGDSRLTINPDDDSFYYPYLDSYFDNNGSESWIYLNSYNLSNGQNKSLFRLVWPSSTSFNTNFQFQVHIDSISVSGGIFALLYDTTKGTLTTVPPREENNQYLAYYNLSSGSSIPTDIKSSISILNGNYVELSAPQTDGKIILWTEWNHSSNSGYPSFSGFYYYNLSNGEINKLDMLNTSEPVYNVGGGEQWKLSDEKLVWTDDRNINVPVISNILKIFTGINDNPNIYYYNLASGESPKRITNQKGVQFDPQIKGNTIFWQQAGNWWTNPADFGAVNPTIGYISLSNL